MNKRKKWGLAIASILSCASVSASASAAELVTNGGFETGDFTGWTLSGNSGFTGIDDDSANSGQFGAFLGPVGSLGYLTQTLNTIAGQDYKISFDLANEGGTPNAFAVSFNGVSGFADKNLAAQAYDAFEFIGKATGASTILQIAFRNDPAFFHLDNVSVQGVAAVIPEPASWALLIVGFGLVGARVRSRRSPVVYA